MSLFFSNSRSHPFFEIGILKNFANFTWKHLSWSLFLINLEAWSPANLLKRDSNTCFFLWKMLNFKKAAFSQNTSGSCFYFWSCSYWSIIKKLLSRLKILIIRKRVYFSLKVIFSVVWWLSFFFVNKDLDEVYSKQLRSYDSGIWKKSVHPNTWTLINKHLL